MGADILVLGASGFVGDAIRRHFEAHGWSVAAGTHRPGAPGVYCGTEEALADALASARAVVDARGGPPSALRREPERLARLAARAGGRALRVVGIGSASIYGEGDGLVDETCPPRPATAYARAKWAAERAWLGALPGRAAVLRPGCVIGAGAPRWVGLIGRLLRAGRLGPLGTAGEGFAHLIDAGDLAEAVRRCLEDGIAGAVNVARPDPPPWNGFFAVLAERLGGGAGPVGAGRLWREAYLGAPVRALAGKLGVGGGDALTPSLRRLFRQKLLILSTRDPLVSWRPLMATLEGCA